MSYYAERNQLVLVKKETTPGTDAAPTVGSNALWAEAPDSTLNAENFETNEVGGTLDDPQGVPAGGTRSFTTVVNLKGSGTAGTAPDYTPLMECAGFAPTAFATDVTGTATAGGASTITLAGGASAVDNFYRGQIIQLTGGTGAANGPRIITGYVGSTKVATVSPSWASVTSNVVPDATSAYAIRKGNLFKLQSTTLPLVTVYHYFHRNDGGNSKLAKLVGACGNMRLSLAPNRSGQLTFELQGGISGRSDVTHPGAATFLNKAAPGFLAGQVYFGNTKLPLNELTFDTGNRVTVEPDPNASYGRGLAGITGRRVAGSFRFPMLLESELDVFTSWLNQTQYGLTALYGSVAGNRVAVYIEKAVFSGVSQAAQDGFIHDTVPFRAGDVDSGLLLYLW
ncbi:MAG: hypothetical protein K0R61_1184 [Microvirga sp.]|jgi:hypothetical protein|nr:hypothetical protein [Microvirga sp.]MDF2970734.1 hypothetical protein [Microvirga sp.]